MKTLCTQDQLPSDGTSSGLNTEEHSEARNDTTGEEVGSILSLAGLFRFYHAKSIQARDVECTVIQLQARIEAKAAQ